PARGPAEILVRPEQIALARDPDGPHEVVERSYFGADQLVELRLAGGPRARARVSPWHDFAPGDRVAATVYGPVVAF
ncbi:MAG TPA: TOBE domain-containing protein, partial [Chloroflexaceae bacterium]|nr:TOBE domain-containing protein [Chloroflexaceae bacterium]